MRLEKGEISSTQLMHLIIGFILGSALLMAFAAKVSGRDTWIAVIFGTLGGLVFAYVYLTLAQRFPGKTLIEINDMIYGKIIGKSISVLYVWFFFSLASLNLRFISDFFVTFLMPETPLVVFCIMFILVCAWAAKEGIEVIARSSFVLNVITSFVIILLTLLLIKKFEWSNLLPILETPLINMVQSSHIVAAIPFGETIVFMMVIAFVNKPKEAKGAAIKAIVFCGILFLVFTIRNTVVLGITGSIFTSPSFQTARLIKIGKVFTRLEVLISIALLSTVFVKIVMFFYASVLGTAKLIGLRTYKHLVIPFAILIISHAVLVYDFSLENDYFGSNIFPVYSFPFEFIIPLTSLIIAKIRKLPKKSKETEI